MTSVQLLDLHIDRASQQVRRGDGVLPVSGLSWRLLDCLLEHGTDVVDFDTLAREVWAPAVVGEDAISQRVKLLRQALGDDSRQPRYVRSVRGRGYQLCAPPQACAPVAPPAAAEPVGVPGAAEPSAATPGTASTPSTAVNAVNAVTAAAAAAAAPSAPSEGPQRRLRARWAWLAAGVAAAGAVIAVIFQRPESALHSPADPVLQRAAYYAGIGQASNNDRAITLYRQALQIDPDSSAARRGLARALAADACLFNGKPGSAQEALQLAGQVLRAAPDDAAAHALRGYAHDCIGAMPQAIADYQQALLRDPDDERTRASLAYLQQEQGHLAQALEANLTLRAPERIRFRDVQVARELELLGFTDAAARRHARNFQLYPDNVFSNIAWPRALMNMGEQEMARQALDQALARGTPHPQLLRLRGELLLMDGDRQGAAAAFEQGRLLRPLQSMGKTLAGLQQGSGTPSPEWIAARLHEVTAQADDGWSDAAVERALLHQAQGDAGAAIADLHRAVDAGFRDAAWLRVTPLFAPLRQAAGWERLLARIDADVAAQRAQVLAASWRPDDLKGLSATPAAGIR
ncbi:winged helix-turn-helix transcriptional regulator [Stenotrophomonas rhizophila]|uniref:winged helix-turn-helix transcriptional regulator n=1 Tax=Stenotrophomonas rhizophila TaxID=216778 RepID=UPI00119F1D6B|nr:winged helix-turn-helix transcriptional regulator [Stenotrophomonas rhizophila]